MSSGRRVLIGAAWTYGSQVAIVVVQFLYAAVTSRLLDDVAFGAYAIALASTAFVSLLATGGLGQAVGRMQVLEADRVRPLVTYALLLGAAAAMLTIVTTPIWVWLWESPEAAGPILWLSLGALIGPLLGLATGLARRLSRYRSLASATFAANVIGMGVGVAVVQAAKTPESLVVAPLIGQFATLSWAIFISDGHLTRLGRLRHAASDIRFSWKMTISSLMSYGVYNTTRIATSRILGTAVVGQWNRADVVTSVPFQQIQAAMVAAIYPEFRHDIGRQARTIRVWTDMLILSSWVAIPAAAVVAVVVPPLVPVLFGPGWGLAAQLAPALAIAGGLQLQSTLLASAVEALGEFRWVWVTQAVLLLLQVGIVVALVAYPDVWIVMLGLIATAIARHSIHIFLCARARLLDAWRLVSHYGGVSLTAAVGAAATFAALELGTLTFASGEWIWMVCACGIVFGLFGGLALGWRRLPPVRIAVAYGILPGKRGPGDTRIEE